MALTPSTEHFRNKSLHPMHSACARLVLRARPADGARSAQKACTPRAPMSSRQTQHCLPIRESTVFWRQTQIEEPAKQKPQAHTHMCRITTHAHDAHTHHVSLPTQCTQCQAPGRFWVYAKGLLAGSTSANAVMRRSTCVMVTPLAICLAVANRHSSI